VKKTAAIQHVCILHSSSSIQVVTFFSNLLVRLSPGFMTVVRRSGQVAEEGDNLNEE
jgi:hypothetical protein